MSSFSKLACVALFSIGCLAMLPATGALAGTDMVFSTLGLVNNWTVFATPPAGAIDRFNIVHLKGNLHQLIGNDQYAFYLPARLIPNREVYVRVVMKDGSTGRLLIYPTGVVFIKAPFQSEARAFTSLEGVSYSKN